MAAGATVGPYILYSGSYSITQLTGAKYGVSSGSFADTFKDVVACSAVPSQTSTSSVISSTTSTSAVASPTLGHKAAVGSYTFQGCYTEATGIRALSEKTYSSDLMTNELCASTCAGYTYFGTEYGRECRLLIQIC